MAAIAERNGRFLLVEERDGSGALVINQPAGHLEGAETLQQAVVRECLEETGYRFRPDAIVGLYLWSHPALERGYLRVCFAGTVEGQDPSRPLDDGIERVLWLNRDELADQNHRHRSPLVLRCIDDYLTGERYPLTLIKSLISN